MPELRRHGRVQLSGRSHRGAAAAIRALAAGCAGLALTGCITISLLDGGGRGLVETRVYGEAGPKILLLEIEGVLSESAPDPVLFFGSEESPVARVREQLDRAREEAEMRAVVLRINSPGGTATASDIIYRELRRFKRETGLPVVAQLMGTATSGAYFVAMAADEVIAQPTTVTGSIGVIYTGVSVAGLMEKLGIENQTLVAGRFKDAGSPLRRMTDEERRQIQSVLDDMHRRFREVVAEGRANLDAAQVEELSDGRIYSAPQAAERGLVDRLGDLPDAVAAAERRAGIDASQVVTYHRSREWKQNLYTRRRDPRGLSPGLRLAPRLPEGAAFLYLWAPGLP